MNSRRVSCSGRAEHERRCQACCETETQILAHALMHHLLAHTASAGIGLVRGGPWRSSSLNARPIRLRTFRSLGCVALDRETRISWLAVAREMIVLMRVQLGSLPTPIPAGNTILARISFRLAVAPASLLRRRSDRQRECGANSAFPRTSNCDRQFCDRPAFPGGGR
jgi:hypothetical protein